MGVGQADFLAGAGVEDIHVPLELAGDDADEGDAIPVLRVHVCLDFENEGGKFFRGRIDGMGVAFPWQRRRGELEETVEQELNAEVVSGGAEEHRSEIPGEDFIDIEVRTRAFEEFEFIANLVVSGFIDGVFDRLILDAGNVHGCAERAVDRALEEVDLLVFPVENTLETRAIAERPIHGKRVDAEDGFQFVEEVEGRPCGAVELVHERENGDSTSAANLEKFPCLSLDALARIDDHDCGIHGGKHAVGVLGEIFVAGGVEDVDHAIFILELQNGGGNRDTALFFQLHPVGGGGALVFPCGDGSGEVQGAAVEEEFFRQGCFSSVRVGNDRE